MHVRILGVAVLLCVLGQAVPSRILMITMAGVKSHKIPFLELARGLTVRGHSVTFISPFPPEAVSPMIEEITPTSLVFYVKNYTNWDLLGARMRGEDPVPPLAMIRFGYEACESLLSDPETRAFLNSGRTFDLLILDGAYPECSLGFVHLYQAPFIYINTVGFYTGSLAMAGNPQPYATTPFLTLQYTDKMNVVQRAYNAGHFMLQRVTHDVLVKFVLERLMRYYLGPNLPPVLELSRNVSFILQNGHSAVTYPRAYLPNVAEIACIHCRPPRPLPSNLEAFLAGGDKGFIYVSMGSAVRASKMPIFLREMFLKVFRQLPYRVVWKWEDGEGSIPDLPDNVWLSAWLPQQDILGHRNIRAFITHGGLHSMFECVYHAVPMVTIPVFCDQDANAAKAEHDGYALKLDFHLLTPEVLLAAIHRVISDPRYTMNVRHRSLLLRDQPETPLQRAVYWTEYVIRHHGAMHLQSPVKDLWFFEYFLLDAALLAGIILALLVALISRYRRGPKKLTRPMLRYKAKAS